MKKLAKKVKGKPRVKDTSVKRKAELEAGGKARFDQLLSDAIFGVAKKK